MRAEWASKPPLTLSPFSPKPALLADVHEPESTPLEPKWSLSGAQSEPKWSPRGAQEEPKVRKYRHIGWARLNLGHGRRVEAQTWPSSPAAAGQAPAVSGHPPPSVSQARARKWSGARMGV